MGGVEESSPGLVGGTVEARDRVRAVPEDGSMDETASRGRGVPNIKERKIPECNRVGRGR